MNNDSNGDNDEPTAREVEIACEDLRLAARHLIISEWMQLWRLGLSKHHIDVAESLPRVFEPFQRKNNNPSSWPITSECERLNNPLFHFCYFHPKLPKVFNIVLRLYPDHFHIEAFFQTSGVEHDQFNKYPTLGNLMFLYPSAYNSPQQGTHGLINRFQRLQIEMRDFTDYDIQFRDESRLQHMGRVHYSTRAIFGCVIGDPRISKHAISAWEEVYGKEILKAWLTDDVLGGDNAEMYFNETQHHEYPYHAINKIADWCEAKEIDLTITNDVGERNGFRHKTIAYPMSETLDIHSTVSETSNSRFALNAIINELCKGPIPVVSCYMFEEGGFLDEWDPAILPTLDQFVLERHVFCNLKKFEVAARVTDSSQIVDFGSSLSGCQAEVQVTLYIHIDSESEVEQWNKSIATMGSVESLRYLGFHMHEESLFPEAGIRDFLASTTSTTCLRICKYPFLTLAPLAEGVARNKSLTEIHLHQGKGVKLDYAPLLSVLYSSNSTLEYYQDDYLDFSNMVSELCRLNTAGRFRLLEPEATKETLVEVLMRLQGDDPRHRDETDGVYELLRVRPALWSS